MKTYLAIGVVGLFMLGCTSTVTNENQIQTHEAMNNYAHTKYVAILQPTQGNEGKQGVVTFEQIDNQVKVTVHIEGMPANSTHGFHVHEYGDCRAADATSAGGHFNPHGHAHAGPEQSVRHMGDLGNITSQTDGTVIFESLDTVLALQGENSILGRAVIVHEQPDDLVSQPVGNAGARVLCGVIGQAK